MILQFWPGKSGLFPTLPSRAGLFLVNLTVPDSILSQTRDMAAAKKFFPHAKEVTDGAPGRVTTDGQNSYPRASRQVLGHKVLHRNSPYLNNRIEQDHRSIKQRTYPMRGLGSLAVAARFCRAHDEQRNYFRARSKPRETVAVAEQRRLFQQRCAAPQDRLIAT